jgi:hypothetical protein
LTLDARLKEMLPPASYTVFAVDGCISWTQPGALRWATSA